MHTVYNVYVLRDWHTNPLQWWRKFWVFIHSKTEAAGLQHKYCKNKRSWIKQAWFTLEVSKGRAAHCERIYGISFVTFLQKHKLIKGNLCKKKKKKSEASLQSNWSIFLCSVNLHNWGNSQQTLKVSQKSNTGNFIAPLKKNRFSKHHIYTPSTLDIQRRENDRKD